MFFFLKQVSGYPFTQSCLCALGHPKLAQVPTCRWIQIQGSVGEELSWDESNTNAGSDRMNGRKLTRVLERSKKLHENMRSWRVVHCYLFQYYHPFFLKCLDNNSMWRKVWCFSWYGALFTQQCHVRPSPPFHGHVGITRRRHVHVFMLDLKSFTIQPSGQHWFTVGVC